MNAQLLAQANAAFRFVVEIEKKREAVFTECTLPVLELELEEVKEGGQNEYVRQLPGQRKASKLTLKNGVSKSTLATWCKNTMEGKFERKSITVHLLDVEHEVIITWDIERAYPIKWVGPTLKSDDNSIAIQTLEFACEAVKVSC